MQMDTVFPYCECVAAFSLAVAAFHALLDARQLRALRRPTPPKELAGQFVDPGLYAKTQAYSIDKLRFSSLKSLYSLAETLVLLLGGGLPWAWVQAGALLARLPPPLARGLGLQPGSSRAWEEMVQSVVFSLLLAYASMATEIPWSLWSAFVVEAKHGFNKQTLGLFVTDTIKSALLTLLFVPLLVMGVAFILIHGGPWLPVYMGGFMLLLSLVFMTLYPSLIQPLFNKSEPLAEGPLRTKIEDLAASLSFPLKKLFTIDGSKRSGHSNAYMYGMFNSKRIVLFDTLLAMKDEQVVAVLAHELGHWKLGHTISLFVASQAIMFLHFLLFSFISNTPQLFSSFGFGGALGQPALIALLLFSFITSPIDEVTGLLMHIVSRRFEYQADAFAVDLGKGVDLREALLKLSEENKAAMHTDRLYSAYHHSHPPLVQRLRAINAAIAAASKKSR